MSTFEHTEVACPACGAACAARTAESVHVGRAPAVRAAILDGSFHVVACACGAKVKIEREFCYTDPDRGLFAHVFPSPGAWTEREQRTLDAFADATQRAGTFGDAWRDTFRLRTVLRLDGLAEKLRIEDAGLDDRIVELLKLELLFGEERLGEDGAVDAVFVDGTYASIDFALVRDGKPERQARVSGDRYRELESDRARVESTYRALFVSPYVSYRRLPG